MTTLEEGLEWKWKRLGGYELVAQASVYKKKKKAVAEVEGPRFS